MNGNDNYLLVSPKYQEAILLFLHTIKTPCKDFQCPALQLYYYVTTDYVNSYHSDFKAAIPMYTEHVSCKSFQSRYITHLQVSVAATNT